MKFICCLLLLMLLPAVTRAEQLENLDSKTLLARGQRLLGQGERLDSAMMCLSVVARRYYKNPNDTSLHATAVIAMKNIADLHLTYFYNYGKAYDYLATAIAVAEEDNMRALLPRLYVSMASLWANNRVMLNKGEKQVAECLKRAWEVAQQDGNSYALLGIGLNMAIMSHGMSSQPFDKELSWLSEQPPVANGARDYPYARSFVKGTLKLNAGQYQEAEHLFREAMALADTEGEYRDRYRLYAVIGIADAMEGRRQHRQAIATLQHEIDYAKQHGADDIALTLYQRLHDTYQSAGIPDSAQMWEYRYLHAREQMLTQANVQDIEQLNLITQVDRMNAQVRDLTIGQHRREIQLAWLIAALAVSLSLAAMLVWRYHTLRRTSGELFAQNQALLKSSRELQEQRAQNLAALPPLERAITIPAHDASSEQEGKYHYSALDGEMSKRLYEELLHILDTHQEIYSTGFTLDCLAELSHTRRNYVSQAINEHVQGGFRQLLLDYRIREACRRLADKDAYGNLTVEGIANSVGIASRSTFSLSFKRVTGLTPAEYRRAAMR